MRVFYYFNIILSQIYPKYYHFDMCYGSVVATKYVSWSPNSQNLRLWPYLHTGSWKRLKMRPFEGALSCMIGVFTWRGAWNTATHSRDIIWWQEDESHLQAKKRGPRRTQPCWCLHLRLLASRTVRKLVSVVLAF